MEQVFAYIIGLGAAVMMPVIFTVLGCCIGIKFGDALKSGLKVGVGFIGLSIVTALLTSALGPALNKVVEIYDLQLKVFDMGWPAAASVAYNTAVGAFIIPGWLINFPIEYPILRRLNVEFSFVSNHCSSILMEWSVLLLSNIFAAISLSGGFSMS